MNPLPFMSKPIAEALALTVATQIGVLRLTLATFFTLAPYAVIANVFVVPLIGIAMIGGWLLLAFAGIAPLAAALGEVDARIIDAILWIVQHVAAWPGTRVVLPPPPWPAVASRVRQPSARRSCDGFFYWMRKCSDIPRGTLG